MEKAIDLSITIESAHFATREALLNWISGLRRHFPDGPVNVTVAKPGEEPLGTCKVCGNPILPDEWSVIGEDGTTWHTMSPDCHPTP